MHVPIEFHFLGTVICAVVAIFVTDAFSALPAWTPAVVTVVFFFLYLYSPLPNGPKCEWEEYDISWGWHTGVYNPNANEQKPLTISPTDE